MSSRLLRIKVEPALTEKRLLKSIREGEAEYQEGNLPVYTSITKALKSLEE